jgi:hypothetical protein
MLIAETLALVALDPLTGETRGKLSKAHSQTALACGLLIELATQMRLGLRGDVVVILDNLPSRHPLLTACLKVARRYSGLLSPEQLMQKVSSDLPRLRDDLLDALYRRDILHPPKRKFWLFGTKRYLIRSTQAQNEGLEAIKKCANGENSKLNGIALLGLACATGVIDHLLVHDEAEEAKARLRLLHDEISIELDVHNEELGELHSIALMERLYQILFARMR